MTKLKLSQTRQELLDNTVAFYSEDVTRRAFDKEKGQCMYHTEDGRNCAIGRELRYPENFGVKEGMPDAGIGENDLFDSLPKRLRSMGQDFLSDIQHLHDHKSYWGDNELSMAGESFVAQLYVKYNLKNYHQ
jgi:hypothetical protein